MKQYPSKFKFKKNHLIAKSNLYLLEQKDFFIKYGNYGIKVLENGQLNFKQIEACRKAIKRTIRKAGQIYIKIFTGLSKTKKSVGSRMGSGKGSHSYWTCLVRAGKIIFEILCQNEDMAWKALLNGADKIPLKTRVYKIIY